jgi:anti-sigma regulatory factor (Ser/Thr protein kinase)
VTELAVETLDRNNLAATLTELKDQGGEASPEEPVRVAFGFRAAPEPAACAVVSSALLTNLSRVPLRVSARSNYAASVVIRCGLASALNTRGAWTTFGAGSDLLDSPRLAATWTPASKAALEAMFTHGPTRAESLFGPDHAVFINAHRTTGRFGPASMTRIVRRWLAQRYEAQTELLDEVSFALDQLVSNIDQHALGETSPYVISQVRVEIDREENRLTLVVLDSGPGVPSTLRAKDDGSFPDTDQAMINSLLAGDLANWGRARGVGLSRLSERLADRGGQLTMISGGVAATVDPGIRAKQLALDAGGTVLAVVLTLA